MMKRSILLSAVATSLLLPPGLVRAAEQESAQKDVQDQTQDAIYGSQLMTQQERDEFRARMRAANTVEEREHIRKQHHEQMKERAKAKGLILPDEPPARGGGMGPGRGMGPGGGIY